MVIEPVQEGEANGNGFFLKRERLRFASSGDSGSLVLRKSDSRIVGLVFGGVSACGASMMNRLVHALKSGFRWSRETSASPSKRVDAAPRAAGLGDAVKSLTSALGVEPCGGCQKRAEWLNRKLPFPARR